MSNFATEEWMRSANIPKKFWGCRMATSDLQRTDAAAHRAAAEFIETFHKRALIDPDMDNYPDQRIIGRGLLLVGKPGTGKTSLSVAAMKSCWGNTRTKFHENITATFIPAATFIQHQIEMIALDPQVRAGQPNAVERYWALYYERDHVRTDRLLVLDDFGKERRTGSGFAEQTLETILRERNTEGKPTIITANEIPEQWTSYHPSIRSFVKEAFDTALLIGEDLRR